MPRICFIPGRNDRIGKRRVEQSMKKIKNSCSHCLKLQGRKGREERMRSARSAEREVKELCHPRGLEGGIQGFSRREMQSPHSQAQQDGRGTSQRGAGQRESGKGGGAGKGQKCRKMGILTSSSPAGSPEHTWAGQLGATIPTLGAESSFLKPGI